MAAGLWASMVAVCAQAIENAARAVLAGRGAAAHARGERGCEIEIEMEAGTYVHRERFEGGVLGGVRECAAEKVFCDID